MIQTWAGTEIGLHLPFSQERAGIISRSARRLSEVCHLHRR